MPRWCAWILSLSLLSLGACSRDRQPVEPAPIPSATSTTAPAAIASSATAATSSTASLVDDAGPSKPGACTVSIRELVEASVGRGSGAVFQNDSERSRALDFGVKHLTCTYSVSVNGAPYRYRHNAEQNYTSGEIDTKKCASDAVKRAAIAQIRKFTEQCKDLHAGEAYGYRLDPE